MVDVKHMVRIGAAVAAAVLGGGLAVSPAHAAPAPASAPKTFGGDFTLPAGAPTPGAGFKIKNAYRVVVGVQEYACAATGTWGTSSTPDALLIRYGSPRPMRHY